MIFSAEFLDRFKKAKEAAKERLHVEVSRSVDELHRMVLDEVLAHHAHLLAENEEDTDDGDDSAILLGAVQSLLADVKEELEADTVQRVETMPLADHTESSETPGDDAEQAAHEESDPDGESVHSETSLDSTDFEVVDSLKVDCSSKRGLSDGDQELACHKKKLKKADSAGGDNGPNSDTNSKGDYSKQGNTDSPATFPVGLPYRFRTALVNCTVSGCRGRFGTTRQLDIHSDFAHSLKRFKCPLENCWKSTNDRFSLLDHCRLDHGRISRWDCLHCDCYFFTGGELSHHQYMKHQEGRFECLRCPFWSKNRLLAMKHFDTAHGKQQ